ncbi:calcium-binding protein [Rhizobium sp. G187]|uniref:calcium-binding protein n=1 Tax=Rhizobium sp. G187 TaxID=3451352 RepID=UPI003EE522DD
MSDTLDYIRNQLAGLGFQAMGADPAVGARTASGTAHGSDGLSREGSSAANVMTATDSADVLNGHAGNDTLIGGDGRDVYVFKAGDGDDVIVDASIEGNIVRFLGGIDPQSIAKTLVAGAEGTQDLLVSYGDGDTIRIIGWSALTAEQQGLWQFEGVDANLSSPNSADTPDISVLPETQGGSALTLIAGTDGDDILNGIDISERFDGKAGDDVIHAGGGDDRLEGGAGNDVLDAGAGNDIVNGGDGDDRLDGSEGNDTLNGGAGVDTVRAGHGNDRITDGDGSDRYLFARGDGADTIYDSNRSGADTLEFTDARLTDVQIVRDNQYDFVLKIVGTEDQVRLSNDVFSEVADTDLIRFSDGVQLTISELARLYFEQAATSGADHIFGFNGDDQVHGADRIAGGTGDDILEGGDGADTYVWNRGDGNDLIIESWSNGDVDQLSLGAGISLSDVTFSRSVETNGSNGVDLIITVGGQNGGSIRLQSYFMAHGIDKIAFADGTVLTRTDIDVRYLSPQISSGADTVFGTAGSNVIDGGAGNDRLQGSDGVDHDFDIYRFGTNFGQDIVFDNGPISGDSGPFSPFGYTGEDRIQFTSFGLSDFTITWSGPDNGNLVLSLVGSSDKVTVEQAKLFAGLIEQYVFSDGVVHDWSVIHTIADITTAATNVIEGSEAGQILSGTLGNDRILSKGGADNVSAGDGDDLINAGSGDDVVDGGAGKDALIGGDGSDTLKAGDGDDLVLGGAGGDTINGDAGIDFLQGDAGDDTIDGGAGDDTVVGGSGNDSLSGGTGTDTLTGGAGNDRYTFNRGDGVDTIDAHTDRGVGEIETVMLGGGITADEVRFSFQGLDLIIGFQNTASDRVIVSDFLASGSVNSVVVGSTSFSLADILKAVTGATNGSDNLGATVETADGLYVIYGGQGDDVLTGSLDRDLFVYSKGDGADTINDWAGPVFQLVARPDELVFGEGIHLEDLVLSRSGANSEDLSITFGSGNDRINLTKQFSSDPTGGVEGMRFEDGTLLSKKQISDLYLAKLATGGDDVISGFGGDDDLRGGAGNDQLRGGGGNDRYLIEAGSGHDIIDDSTGSSDRLEFAAGISASAVTVTRVGNDAVLRLSGTDSVTLKNMFATGSAAIETIAFADGTTWNSNTLLQQIASNAVTGGADTILGSAITDSLRGGTGNDRLDGGEGGDIYQFDHGDGADVLADSGLTGNDVLSLGSTISSADVSVSYSPSAPNDIIVHLGGGDTIVLQNQLSGSGAIEQVRFASGEIWSAAELIQKALAAAQTAGNDTLVGSTLSDRIVGGHGNDLIDGGNGADTYVFNRGDGSDTIRDGGDAIGMDRIELGSGIVATDLDLSHGLSNPNDLVITIRGSGDTIIVENHFAAGGGKIGAIQFADGSRWNATDISSLAGNTVPTVVGTVSQQNDVQGSPFSFVLPAGLFADTDLGDTLQFAATLTDGSPLPTWLTFDGTAFSGSPANGDVGQIAIRLTAIDAAGDRVSQNFNIVIANVNDAPVAVAPPTNQSVAVGAHLQFQLPAGLFIDPDNQIMGAPGQNLTLSATLSDGTALPSWLSFNPTTGTFSGTPAAANAGVLDIIISASDGIAVGTTRLGISVGGGNSAPTVANAIGTLSASEDSPFSFTIPSNVFADATPGDHLRYSATLSDGSPLPSWLSLNAVTGTFFGLPENGDVGTLSLKVTATDIAGASVSTLVSLNVLNSNDAPVASGSLESWFTSEDTAFSYTVPTSAFSDADAADHLVYSAALVGGDALPAWLHFDPVTGHFSGTPDDGDVGMLPIVVKATDQAGASAELTMYLIVNGRNDAPYVAHQIASITVDRDAPSAFTMTIPADSFADADSLGLNLSLRLANGDPLPEWMTFDPLTRTLSGDPPFYSVDNEEGRRLYQIEVTASDADGATASQILDLFVQSPYPGVTVTGTAGDDTLSGTIGPDIFSGGAGNDEMLGGAGSDTYLFGRGDGQDTVLKYDPDGDYTVNDVVRFAAGIAPSDIIVTRNGYISYETNDSTVIDSYFMTDLVLTIRGTSDSITIKEQFRNSGDDFDAPGPYSVKEVQFANGTVWSAADLATLFSTPTSGNDFIQGDFKANILSGGAGNDRLVGLGGNDVLDGGTGNDDLYGGSGDDTYLFNLGSGTDRVIDTHDGLREFTFDTLRFGAGITLANLVFTRDTNDPYNIFAARDAGSLLIQIAGTNDKVKIYDQYAFENGLSGGVERFEFADGTVLTLTELDEIINPGAVLQGTNGADVLTGTTANERIIGGKGADRLLGGNGDDTYVWNSGDGNDIIAESDIPSFDVLEFGQGIRFEDVRLSRTPYEVSGGTFFDLYIDVLSTGERITIDNGVILDVSDTGDFERPIDAIRFADGREWTFEQIVQFFLQGTPGDDQLTGYDPRSDVLDGGAGNDVLRGQGGSDAYVFGYGYGNDTVYDAVGSFYIFYPEDAEDLVRFLPGVDQSNIEFSTVRTTNSDGELETFIVFGLAGSNDELRIYDGGASIYRYFFQQTQTFWTAAQMRDAYLSQVLTAGNDLVLGFGDGRRIDAGAGNDTLIGKDGDFLIGGAGNDTYEQGLYAGQVIVWDAGTAADHDILKLSGIIDPLTYDPSEGAFQKALNGRDLYVWGYSVFDAPDVILRDFFVGSASTIDEIIFEDGTHWNRAQIIAHTIDREAATPLIGTTASETLTGNDEISNAFEGKAGDDTLVGGVYKQDVYLWRLGDGNDTIVDEENYFPSNLLKLLDVASSGVAITRVGNDLKIRIVASGEVITIDEHFALTTREGKGGIGELQFSDGVLWRREDIDARAIFEGTVGNDVITGTTGADTMKGLAGDDTYVVNAIDDIIIEAANGGADTVQSSLNYKLGDNLENLTLTGSASLSGTGNADANILVGNSGSNTLTGLSGNDTLNGASGADTLIGGLGDDIYVVDTSSDLVVENQGEGNDSVQTVVSLTLAANVENLSLTGSSAINGTGNGQANNIVGNGANNVLAGLGGADSLDGGAGSDTASYAASAAAVTISLATATADGGDATGDILLNIENILGSGFDDTIEGNAGTNNLNGGAGIDTLSYSHAAAGISINIGSTAAQATGGAGTDTVSAFENIIGSAFTDTLTGSTGVNVLTGGFGADTLLGKAGSDLYIYRAGDGDDTINDDSGSTAEIDTLDLSFVASSDTLLTRVGQDLKIRINTTGETITVRNQFLSTTANWGIESLRFSDTTWDLSTINTNAWYRGTGSTETITGSDTTADTIDPGAGNDTLVGGFGNDVYIYASGYGNDTVNEKTTGSDIDTLKLVGLTQADIRFERPFNDQTDVVIRILSSGETLTLDTQFDLEGGVERIVFADGSVLGAADWSLDALLSSLAAIYGTSGNDQITGSAGNDMIRGLAGDDTISGGTGADILEGGQGNDTYTLDNVGDTVVELSGEGTDLVRSSTDHTLEANVENLTLTGSAAINGAGNILANQLIGNTGNNILEGGAGADAIDGGSGTDTASYSTSASGVTVNLTTATATGGDAAGDVLTNIENLTGSGFDDSLTGNTAANVLFGGAGNDLLSGGTGNDTLDGGTGSDIMTGGTGNDIYVIDEASDSIVENANDGTDTVQSSIDYTLSANLENLTLLGAASVNGAGNAGANILIGNEAGNQLSGNDGNDTLSGNAGNDSLSGGAGNDAHDGGLGADLMNGGLGNDTYIVDDIGDAVVEAPNEGTDSVTASITYALAANVENLTLSGASAIDGTGNALANAITGNTGSNHLSGGDGNDTLAGAAGDDVIDGGNGNDTIDGGTGVDAMSGGAGDDTYTIDNLGDSVVELAGEGTDTARSSVSILLAANVENLTLTGSSAINGTGNAGANVITGNSGNNIIAGLAGADRLDGAGGNDTVSYETSSAAVSINLATSSASGGDATGDVLLNFENITGSQFDDTLTGNSTVNILTGSGGNDMLSAGTGSDTYVYLRGDGNDTIAENADANGLLDQIILSNINATAIKLHQDGNDLRIVIAESASGAGDAGSILVKETIDGTNGAGIEKIAFADGTVWLKADILSNISQVPQGPEPTVSGTSGDDTLSGTAGADIFEGGAGNDTLYGSEGSDTYLYALGDGTDYIDDEANQSEEVDLLLFTDLSSDDVSVTRDGVNLKLTMLATGDTISIDEQFWSPYDFWGFERIEFADGVAWDRDTLMGFVTTVTFTAGTSGDDRLVGAWNDETFQGGLGNDTLLGSLGADVYVYAAGDGTDYIDDEANEAAIVDIVRFTDLNASDISASREGIHLKLTVISTGDTITIDEQYYTQTDFWGVERIEFADGSSWNRSTIMAIGGSVDEATIVGTTGDDTLSGTWENDVFRGGLGNDILDGSAGSDTYLYASGDGSDVISDEVGFTDNFDVLRFSDLNASDLSISRDLDRLLLTVVATGDVITVEMQLHTDPGYWGLESIEFADGSSWDRDTIITKGLASGEAITVNGTDGDDVLDGTWTDDIYHGGLGDDVLIGSSGSDIYLYAAGDGNDTVRDEQGYFDNFDILRFSDLTAFDIVVTRFGDAIRLTVTATGDVITVTQQLRTDEGYWGLEKVEFAGGASWDRDTFIARGLSAPEEVTVAGTAGDDTLNGTFTHDLFHGGLGNDILFGGEGSDTYLYALGDGTDYLDDEANQSTQLDILRFSDINQSDVSAERSGVNLVLTVLATGDTITIDEQYYSDEQYWGFEKIEFADGSSWDRDDLMSIGAQARVAMSVQDDAFIFEPNFVHDTIVDFQGGSEAGEIVGLETDLFADFASALEAATQVGADTVMTLDVNNTIILKNVALTSLHHDDFRFTAAA